MKLRVSTREKAGKSFTKTIRREGNIPAILYSKGKEGMALTIQGKDFEAGMRALKKGSLPNTPWTLLFDDGKEYLALVKDIQYHVTRGDVLHLDFLELHPKRQINVKVPIRLKNEESCEGIRLGGRARMVIRHFKLRCLPKDIPQELWVDIEHLGLKASARLSAISLPKNVSAMMNIEEVAIVIAK